MSVSVEEARRSADAPLDHATVRHSLERPTTRINEELPADLLANAKRATEAEHEMSLWQGESIWAYT